MQIFTNASSGMRAATLRMDVAASNLANAQTLGAHSSRTTEAPNVDTSDELLATMQASLAYRADARVLKAGDDLLGTTLDMLG